MKASGDACFSASLRIEARGHRKYPFIDGPDGDKLLLETEVFSEVQKTSPWSASGLRTFAVAIDTTDRVGDKIALGLHSQHDLVV